MGGGGVGGGGEGLGGVGGGGEGLGGVGGGGVGGGGEGSGEGGGGVGGGGDGGGGRVGGGGEGGDDGGGGGTCGPPAGTAGGYDGGGDGGTCWMQPSPMHSRSATRMTTSSAHARMRPVFATSLEIETREAPHRSTCSEPSVSGRPPRQFKSLAHAPFGAPPHHTEPNAGGAEGTAAIFRAQLSAVWGFGSAVAGGLIIRAGG